jgi:hypothetical protein
MVELKLKQVLLMDAQEKETEKILREEREYYRKRDSFQKRDGKSMSMISLLLRLWGSYCALGIRECNCRKVHNTGALASVINISFPHIK